MWSFLVWLISSRIAAKVVDLPLPVSPVIKTIPLGNKGNLLTTSGNPSS